MAAVGLFRPLWSEAILEELHEHEVRKLIRRGASRGFARSRAAYLDSQMRIHFDDALVIGWERLEGSFGLADSNDEHVVAAAVSGGAGAIVTNNIKDFPDDRIPPSIRVLSPAEFAKHIVSINPPLAAQAIFEISHRRQNPQESPLKILQTLESIYGMVEVNELLSPLFADS